MSEGVRIDRAAPEAARLPPVVRSVAELRLTVGRWRAAGETVGLVPTMGALHHGHLSLVDQMARETDRIVVSIFVNPKQFGPQEDFSNYPRRERADRETLSTTPADLVFAPPVGEMYPPGFATAVSVAGLSDDMEGAHRPGHFDGVATVVAKLFNQCAPDAAIFGEKDYQQLVVIRRFVRDLDMPVRVLGAPIVREPDGLAASSRNAYLNDEQRRIGAGLNRVLSDLKRRAEARESVAALEKEGRQALHDAGFDAVDYLCFRDAGNLEPLKRLDRPARLLCTARLGRTRLLDNVAVAPVDDGADTPGG